MAPEDDYKSRNDRIEAIVGENGWDIAEAMPRFLSHIQAHLVLPCEVTGQEDFNWEERYFFLLLIFFDNNKKKMRKKAIFL